MFKPFSTVMAKARVALLVTGLGATVALGSLAAPSAYAMPISHKCDGLIPRHNRYQSIILNPNSSWQDALSAARSDNALIDYARARGCGGI